MKMEQGVGVMVGESASCLLESVTTVLASLAAKAAGASLAGGVFALLALANQVFSDPCAAASPPLPKTIAAPAWMPGVNLAVGEFGSGQRLWFDYGYPGNAEIDYYVGKGFKLFRVPFKASRLLQANGTALSFRGDQAVLGKLIDYAASRHAFVVLDMHDYGRSISGKLIGHDPGAAAEFAATWGKIAGWLKARPNVVFGLMNEPHDQSATEWLRGANAAILAIRRAGAGQLILVPGSYWDGAFSWKSTDNDTVMLGVSDPIANYAFEAHQYLDASNTGNPAKAVAKGMGSVAAQPFTDWLRQNHKRGFIGEFGFTTAPDALAEGDALTRHIWQNRDVYLGFSYWAGGPWWGEYPFTVEPKEANGRVIDRAQMPVLRRYLRQ